MSHDGGKDVRLIKRLHGQSSTLFVDIPIDFQNEIPVKDN